MTRRIGAAQIVLGMTINCPHSIFVILLYCCVAVKFGRVAFGAGGV